MLRLERLLMDWQAGNTPPTVEDMDQKSSTTSASSADDSAPLMKSGLLVKYGSKVLPPHAAAALE
jgi:hypothetical protein